MDEELTTIEEQPEPAIEDLQEAPADETQEAEEATGPRLVLRRNGADTEEVFPLHSPSIVGRFDPTVGPVDVDLGPLPEGVYVSRKHAKIWEEDGVWKVVDLGSSNGTFLLQDDFERIEEGELSDGCEIAFGNARFVFKL